MAHRRTRRRFTREYKAQAVQRLIERGRPLADISYIPTDEGFLYLAAIKDMTTREIVGWAMADHLKAGLCIDALVMALQRCQPPRGFIHHSDRGSQGGLKRSSQQEHLEPIAGTDPAPLRVFSSRGPFAVAH